MLAEFVLLDENPGPPRRSTSLEVRVACQRSVDRSTHFDGGQRLRATDRHHQDGERVAGSRRGDDEFLRDEPDVTSDDARRCGIGQADVGDAGGIGNLRKIGLVVEQADIGERRLAGRVTHEHDDPASGGRARLL